MKKIFLLIACAVSISTQSFAAFEKDGDDDYLLTPTSELFNYIAKRLTVIDDTIDGKKYKILVEITADNLDLLNEAFLKKQIICIYKEQKSISEQTNNSINYIAYTELLDSISFSLKTLQIGWGHMHY